MQKYIHTTWRLWKLLKPFHSYFYLQLFLTLTKQAIGIYGVYILAKVVDYAVDKNINLVITSFLAYFVSIIVYRLIGFYSDRKEVEKSYGAIQQFLEEYSLKNIFKLNPSQYTENHSSIKQRVVDQGESAVQSIIETLLLEVIPLVSYFVFSVGAIFYYSKFIGILCFVTIITVVFITMRFTSKWRVLQRKNIDNWDVQRKIKVEAFEHLSLVKIFSMENFYVKKYLKNRLNITDYHVSVWMKNVNFRNLRDIFTACSRLTGLSIAVYLFIIGHITVGVVYAILSWINRMYDQLGNVNSILRTLPTNYIYLEKYLNMIDIKPLFEENSIIKFVDGDIAFENLSFKYPKGESNVLDDVNIVIPRGKKVAFVGASGSGKTTITRLLLRAYDYGRAGGAADEKSSIRINNVELSDIDAHSLRRAIGYVEQHVDLFDDTIKNNILFGVDEKVLNKLSKEKSEKFYIDINGKEVKYKNKLEERVEEVARLARIDEFYHRLGESKFETEIGERGIKLSGGERQRIGIARAIIKDPAILIFDEATSALDTVNEKYIKEAIDNVSIGRTTIIIAHRLSTVLDSDIIFVMNQGKVVAQGTHIELITTSEYYRELIKHQELK